MVSSKSQGWYIYQRQTIAVMHPEQLKWACDQCNSTDLAWLKNKETGEEAYVCRSCDYGKVVEKEKAS